MQTSDAGGAGEPENASAVREQLENLQLVPEVFHLLAPLMKVFGRGIGMGNGEGLAALTIHTLQPNTDHRPSMVPDRPAQGTLVYPTEYVALRLECVRPFQNAVSYSGVLPV
jgi:hypothetical protein